MTYAVVGLLAFLLGWWSHRRRQQRAAREQVHVDPHSPRYRPS